MFSKLFLLTSVSALFAFHSVAEVSQDLFLETSIEACLSADENHSGWAEINPESNPTLQSLANDFRQYSSNQTNTFFNAYGADDTPEVYLIRSGGEFGGAIRMQTCSLIAPNALFDISPELLAQEIGVSPSFSGPSGPHEMKFSWQSNIPAEPGLTIEYVKFDPSWDKQSGIAAVFARVIPITN